MSKSTADKNVEEEKVAPVAEEPKDSSDLEPLDKEAVGETTVGTQEGAPDSTQAVQDVLDGSYDPADPENNGMEAGPSTPEHAALVAADNGAKVELDLDKATDAPHGSLTPQQLDLGITAKVFPDGSRVYLNPDGVQFDDIVSAEASMRDEDAAPSEEKLEGDLSSGGLSVTMDGGNVELPQTEKNPATGDDIDIDTEEFKKTKTPADKLKKARELISEHPMAGGVESEVAKLLIEAGDSLGLKGYSELSGMIGGDGSMKRVRGLWDGTQRIFADLHGNVCLTITKSLMEVDRAISPQS